MTITVGTPIKLPDGRNGVVIPSAYRLHGRVRIKVQGGRKIWLQEDDCVPTYEFEESAMVKHQESA
jgi:hypothetical protein